MCEFMGNEWELSLVIAIKQAVAILHT